MLHYWSPFLMDKQEHPSNFPKSKTWEEESRHWAIHSHITARSPCSRVKRVLVFTTHVPSTFLLWNLSKYKVQERDLIRFIRRILEIKLKMRMTMNTDQLPASRPENVPIQTRTPEDAPQSYLLSTTLPLPMRFSQKVIKGPAPSHAH